MSYVEGFVAAVPAANKQAYQRHAEEAWAMFRDCGVTRMVECWGDDVPDGKVTDFRGAVKAEDGEVIVFSWMEFPSREARDAGFAKMMADPRAEEMGANMPFDGKRMIMGGFAPLLDSGRGGAMGYADGYLLPVPHGNREAYRELAEQAAVVFLDHGAIRVVEAWGDDVPDGKITDHRRAVKAEESENVVFSWIEWPSKDVRDEGSKKVMADPRMQMDHSNAPFDGKRMIYGGFMPILDV